jgi:hypothetical protein
MPNYDNVGNRFTAIYVLHSNKGGQNPLYTKSAMEIVRFNVDENPSAPEEIIPVGQQNTTPKATRRQSKLYEGVRFLDSEPWKGKHDFGSEGQEGGA